MRGRLALAAAGLLAAALPAQAQWARAKPVLPLGPQEQIFPLGALFRLVSINGKPVEGDMTLQIDANYRGSGFSGCNTWSAALYPLKGQHFAMGPVAMTRKMCPPAVMAQERAILYTLHSGPAWHMDGPIMTVKSRAGTLQFRQGF